MRVLFISDVPSRCQPLREEVGITAAVSAVSSEDDSQTGAHQRRWENSAAAEDAIPAGYSHRQNPEVSEKAEFRDNGLFSHRFPWSLR